MQAFWKAVCKEISSVIKQTLIPTPLVCLLGFLPDGLKMYKEIVQFLLMVARKTVMFKWVGSEGPTLKMWKT